VRNRRRPGQYCSAREPGGLSYILWLAEVAL
jgi:hypothetical protein